MTLTVANMGDQALRLAQFLTDDFHDLDVLLFIMTANIVNFTNTTLVDNQINGLAVVFDIQPVTNI